MKFIPDDINIDFMAKRSKAFALSAILMVGSLGAIVGMGLNFGIDFAGGSSVIVSFKADEPVDRTQLEETVKKLVDRKLERTGTAVSVQDFSAGSSDTGTDGQAVKRFLIYTEVTSLISDDQSAKIAAALKAKFGDKTRIDVPSEGADIFYLTFPSEVDIATRYTALRKTYSDLGYKKMSVRSDIQQQLENACNEWYALVGEERAGQKSADGADMGTEDLDAQHAECMAKITSELKGKKDKRYQVTVEELKAEVEKELSAAFPNKFLSVDESTSVSASVGKDLLNNGLLAVLYAIIGILIYITMRFDFRYAPGAVVALVHDVIFTMGIFAVLQLKFSLPIIAALLTIVGYSLNDTIVVLDRVRETFDAYRGRDISELLNRAVNNTLSRTVLTSVTTALVVAAILILGGGLIADFAWALMIGIIVGTYSSVFIATPLVYYMDGYLKRREAALKVSGGGNNAKPSPA